MLLWPRLATYRNLPSGVMRHSAVEFWLASNSSGSDEIDCCRVTPFVISSRVYIDAPSSTLSPVTVLGDRPARQAIPAKSHVAEFPPKRPAALEAEQPPARWATDPYARHEQRYWDGRKWTEHVSTNGVAAIDPPTWGQEPADVVARRTAPVASPFAPPSIANGVPSLVGGGSHTITTAGHIGRDPVSPNADEQDVLIRLSDLSRSISKTHLSFGVDSGELWVMDRGSTNGSSMKAAGVEPVALAPMERCSVPRGGIVHIGDRCFHVT